MVWESLFSRVLIDGCQSFCFLESLMLLLIHYLLHMDPWQSAEHFLKGGIKLFDAQSLGLREFGLILNHPYNILSDILLHQNFIWREVILYKWLFWRDIILYKWLFWSLIWLIILRPLNHLGIWNLPLQFVFKLRIIYYLIDEEISVKLILCWIQRQNSMSFLSRYSKVLTRQIICNLIYMFFGFLIKEITTVISTLHLVWRRVILLDTWWFKHLINIIVNDIVVLHYVLVILCILCFYLRRRLKMIDLILGVNHTNTFE